VPSLPTLNQLYSYSKRAIFIDWTEELYTALSIMVSDYFNIFIWQTIFIFSQGMIVYCNIPAEISLKPLQRRNQLKLIVYPTAFSSCLNVLVVKLETFIFLTNVPKA